MEPEDYTPIQNSGESVGGIANLKPFPKGVSGNPNGRPKGIRNRSTIVREALEAKIRGEDGNEIEVVDALVVAQVAKAMTGDTPAFKELMDSGYGKLTDKQEISGPDGAAISIMPADEAYKALKG